MRDWQERWLWYLIVACALPFGVAASIGAYYLFARVWVSL